MQPYFQISNILVILKRDYFEVKFEAFYKSKKELFKIQIMLQERAMMQFK